MTATPTPEGSIEVEVVNESHRTIRIPAAYPFWQCDWFLLFDRDRSTGYRLDAPPGSFVDFEPHATRVVRLIPISSEPSTGGSAP
jgi:urease subunit beta